MIKYRYFLAFFIILSILALACSIQKIEPENPAPLTVTNTPNPTATCTNPAPLTEIGTVNVAEGLNLRKEPNEHSEVIVTLLPNSEVEILSEDENGWLCVKVLVIREDMTKLEITGYVNGDFIER